MKNYVLTFSVWSNNGMPSTLTRTYRSKSYQNAKARGLKEFRHGVIDAETQEHNEVNLISVKEV